MNKKKKKMVDDEETLATRRHGQEQVHSSWNLRVHPSSVSSLAQHSYCEGAFQYKVTQRGDGGCQGDSRGNNTYHENTAEHFWGDIVAMPRAGSSLAVMHGRCGLHGCDMQHSTRLPRQEGYPQDEMQ